MKGVPIRFIITHTLTNALIFGAVLYGVLAFWPIVKEELTYQWRSWRGVNYVLEEEALREPAEKNNTTRVDDSGYFATFKGVPTQQTITITPTSRAFGLVIQKIGVNVKVVKDVDSTDAEAYDRALRQGVAHAQGTSYPGEGGNVYIHGHSSLGYWQLGNYATVFTLLSKLERGDHIVIFYEDERYDYQVFNKEVFPGYDTTPLLRDYDESVLTLQTCDPPGTTLNRLIVTARLIN